MRRKLKILLYGDVDLNIMDGSAVWLTSMANVLNKDPNISVDVLLKSPIRNKNLVSEIEGLSQINIIDTYEVFQKEFENGYRINTQEASLLMEELDHDKQYHCIIVRGFQMVMDLLESPLHKKVIPYITEFTHDTQEIQADEKAVLQKIYQTFPKMFVQTPEADRRLQDILDVDGEKLCLLTPMIPDYEDLPDFTNHHNRIVYTGKFAEGWYTEEMLSAFKQLHEKDPLTELFIAGDKFQGELSFESNRISKQMYTQAGVNWVGAIPRTQSLQFVDESDLGFCWRSETIDNDLSVELSTKLLEYGRLGKPVLLRRTKMYEKLFGEDYFLFIEDEDDFVEKTLQIMYDRKLYRKTAKKVYKACKEYTFTEAYKRLKPVLWSFNHEKVKIVFAGHDLKFIKMAMEYFNNDERFEVKIDQWQGHQNHDENHSQECIEWADIIFCEWGLGNAVWYSNHKKKGQKLIVRMHLQERETNFPEQFDMDQIDKIIAISPYIFEEFHRVCHIPREKMVMIYNMIDTEHFNQPKLDSTDIMYHLGICGILPSRKRLDRALNVLEKLWEKDHRYKLFVKSRMPQDLAWLMKRKEEKLYYDDVFERIKKAPWGENVIFDQHGSDMDEWFRKIGYVLSTSDFESFHLAPMEGAASGSVPIVLHWPGAETIYPKEFLFEDEDQIVQFIESKQAAQLVGDEMKQYPQMNFDKSSIISQIEKCILA